MVWEILTYQREENNMIEEKKEKVGGKNGY